VSRVFVDDEHHSMLVVVPDDQLSLAIGKNGQNVRLAVKLTGWKLDVKSETLEANKTEEGFAVLTKIPGIDEGLAERLFNEGLRSVAAVAAANAEMLSAIPGISEQQAQSWIREATKLLDQELGVG